MSERKVLNKYYPPDFDPSKIPRLRLPKERQYTVRLMAPCNMRCTTCGEYIYKGKKFNARKETVQNEEYLGIKIYRFYIKCPRCLAEVTFKTDPENADYIVEHGASRNFQALKLAEEAAEKEAREKEEEEKNNPMKMLENRTKASKQEMESIEKLEEIKDLNQRHAKVDFEQLLKQNHMKLVEEQKRQEEEDEAFIRSVFLTADGKRVNRIYDEAKYENKGTDPTKLEAGNAVVTDVSSEKEGSGMSENPAKKPKLDSHASTSSRQRSIEMLKRAVKMKIPAVDMNDVKSATPVTVTKKDTCLRNDKIPDINSNSASGSSNASGLGLLSAYSDSDSESS